MGASTLRSEEDDLRGHEAAECMAGMVGIRMNASGLALTAGYPGPT